EECKENSPVYLTKSPPCCGGRFNALELDLPRHKTCVAAFPEVAVLFAVVKPRNGSRTVGSAEILVRVDKSDLARRRLAARYNDYVIAEAPVAGDPDRSLCSQCVLQHVGVDI